jgi:hypothetical protein
MRATFMPASTIAWKIAGSWLAGPIVQTILARRTQAVMQSGRSSCFRPYGYSLWEPTATARERPGRCAAIHA